MRLRDLSEGGFIRRIRERFSDSRIPVGIGDDAAILDVPEGHSLVYCSDLVTENTHFIRGMHPPDSVGYKAVAVNVSDVGAMGGVPMGLELLRAGTREGDAVKRHLYPQPRYRVGAAVRNVAHAMIDVSDGLSTDLGHIVEESRVSARIYKDKLPAATGASDAHVLHGGEEYELLITATSLPEEIEGVKLTRIGEVVESIGGRHRVYLGETVLEPRGWDHYGR